MVRRNSEVFILSCRLDCRLLYGVLLLLRKTSSLFSVYPYAIREYSINFQNDFNIKYGKFRPKTGYEGPDGGI